MLSPAGNRTPVSRVTGGDTDHYTTEDLLTDEILRNRTLFNLKFFLFQQLQYLILVSIVVSIPACHAGDRGSIPQRGVFLFCYRLIRKKLCSPRRGIEPRSPA